MMEEKSKVQYMHISMENLRAGQRINLYKIVTNGGFGSKQFTPGTIRMGYQHGVFAAIFNNQFKQQTMFTELKNPEAKLIGQLIIRKVK